jgi:hypothetical protein
VLNQHVTSESAKALIRDLASSGIRAESPQCDVSNVPELERVIAHYSETMPPIKGCMQGVLNLQDSLFGSMTYQQWLKVIDPRVKGTQALYSLLGKKLDFFILFSSATGILGEIGQANYAVSNTFLDRFALLHGSQSRPIISLDLGYLEFAGTVAESEFLIEQFCDGSSGSDVASTLDYYIWSSVFPMHFRASSSLA